MNYFRLTAAVYRFMKAEGEGSINAFLTALGFFFVYPFLSRRVKDVAMQDIAPFLKP